MRLLIGVIALDAQGKGALALSDILFVRVDPHATKVVAKLDFCANNLFVAFKAQKLEEGCLRL